MTRTARPALLASRGRAALRRPAADRQQTFIHPSWAPYGYGEPAPPPASALPQDQPADTSAAEAASRMAKARRQPRDRVAVGALVIGVCGLALAAVPVAYGLALGLAVVALTLGYLTLGLRRRGRATNLPIAVAATFLGIAALGSTGASYAGSHAGHSAPAAKAVAAR